MGPAHRTWPLNSCWKPTHKKGVHGIINVFFMSGLLVRSHKDSEKWIPHLAVTSAPGPGAQLQLTCRPPSSRTLQKDSWGDGPALPRLPGLQRALSRPPPESRSPHTLESRKRAFPWKVAKAAFLWTTQEMYVRKLFHVLFSCGLVMGFHECSWACRLCKLKWGHTAHPLVVEEGTPIIIPNRQKLAAQSSVRLG